MKLFFSYKHRLLLPVHFCLHSSKCSRSLEAKKRRNRIKKEKRKQKKLRNFNQEKESRLQMESQVMTLQKENRLLKQTLRESRKHIGSRVSSKPYFSTIMSMCKDKSNDIIKKFQKTIPLFHSYDVFQTDVLGLGAYGTVRQGYIKSMQLKVAVKSFSESSKNRHILAEGLIYSEMSGNPHFLFFYGMIKSRFLLIECIDNSTTLRKSLEKNCFILKWESICSDIVRAVHSLHLKGILHMICIAITYCKGEIVM